MTTDAFKEEFPYFSVNVPTSFPSAGATDPLAAKHQGSPNSYLRLGDTPTPTDLNGQDEPGLEQRSELLGIPQWPLDLYRSFAPDNSDTVPNGDVLRVNAGESEPLDVDGNFYKNVGWLDHCNGHRVSTTHGDKVEIITGNYKLVVLGREGDAQKSTGFDMSGGHTTNWAQTPGAIRTITAEADTFKVTSVTDAGHEYNVFDGFDTYHLVGGSSYVSVMGGDNDRTEKGGGPAELVADAAWANKIFSSDFATTVINIDAGDPGQANPWPSLSETQDLKTNAAAFSAAPASYDDVAALPKADKIIEARSGATVFDWISGETIEEQIAAASHKERLDASEVENKITATTELKEIWNCESYAETFIGDRINVTAGLLETELHMAGVQTNVSVSMAAQDITLGGLRMSFEGCILSAAFSISPFFLEFNAGTTIEREAMVTEWNDCYIKKCLVSLSSGGFRSGNSAIQIDSSSAVTMQV